MYYIDYHTHTNLSPDGNVPLVEMAQAAVDAGISELCVTDHYDRIQERGGFAADYDWAPAMAQFLETAPKFAGQLQLKLGIEYGSGPFDSEYASQMLSLPELDFVIGSLHNLSPEKGGTDFYFLTYDSQEICYAALDDYFSSMAQLAAQPELYDVLGHIIYPLRYMPETISLSRYLEQIDVILKQTAQTGRGIEVNTYCGKTIAPWKPILERFRFHGGEFVTVGSDAHLPQRVGLGIPEAYEMLQQVGFRYVATYEKRHPNMIAL